MEVIASWVQRYIRLNELIPELIEMVDGNEINSIPPKLAFLRPEEQAVLYDIYRRNTVTFKAQRLSKGRLSEQDIAAIMREEKALRKEVTLPAKGDRTILSEKLHARTEKRVIVKLKWQAGHASGNKTLG